MGQYARELNSSFAHLLRIIIEGAKETGSPDVIEFARTGLYPAYCEIKEQAAENAKPFDEL